MPFFPTRSAPKPLPISLVKPAEKLQPSLFFIEDRKWSGEKITGHFLKFRKCMYTVFFEISSWSATLTTASLMLKMPFSYFSLFQP